MQGTWIAFKSRHPSAMILFYTIKSSWSPMLKTLDSCSIFSMSKDRKQEKKVRQKLSVVFAGQEVETGLKVMRFLDAKTNSQKGRPEEWNTLIDYLDNEQYFKRYAEEIANFGNGILEARTTEKPTGHEEQRLQKPYGPPKEGQSQTAESSRMSSTSDRYEFTITDAKTPESTTVNVHELRKKFEQVFSIALVGQHNSGQSTLICKLQKWCDLPTIAKLSNKDGVKTVEHHYLNIDGHEALIWELPPIDVAHYSAETYWRNYQLEKYNLTIMLIGKTFDDIHKDIIRYVSELPLPKPIIAVTIAPTGMRNESTVNAVTQFANKYQYSNCTACAVSVLADLKTPEAFSLDEDEFLTRLLMYYRQYQDTKRNRHIGATDQTSLPA